MESKEIQEKIIRIIQEKGPSLPVHISNKIGLNSLFISAFLAELSSEKRIKTSNLKVGGSPLYFIPGQENLLENYYKYLHPKEAETFLLLKKKGILKDSEQDPAIRVALRSIRDFSIGFKFNNEIYWRYLTFPENEALSLIKGKPKISIKKSENIKNQTKTAKSIEFINPLAKKERVEKKEKNKSKFVEAIIKAITEKYRIIEEKTCKNKEYKCILEIKSELGPIKFYTQAKDKKIITESDVKNLLAEAQSIPLPALIIHTGKLSKKAKEYIETYSSILKNKKIN